MGPRYFTRAELHEYGVIDLPSAHFGDLKQTAIHPLLSRESFPHVTAAEYAALRPGLALASAYLSSPSGWYFWQTVLYGSRTEIPDTPGWQVLEPAYPPAFTTAAEQRAFAELLVQMRSVFAFTFREKEVSAEVLDAIAKIRKERNLTGKVAPYLWGMTQAYDRTQYDPSWKHPLGRSYGGASYITLNPIFLQHAMAAAELRGGSSASVSHSQAQAVTTTAPEQPNLSLQRRPLTVQDLQKPLPDPPRPEPTSAQISLVLRQQFHFATTVLHELAHAFNNVVRHKGQVEPFWCDQRRAELGYAFEAFTHGGRLGAVHANRHCKWGMEFTGWPPGPEAMEIIGPTTKVKGEKPKYGPAGAEWNRRASREFFLFRRSFSFGFPCVGAADGHR